MFFEVYNELGYGFLESVYQGAMCVALSQSGLGVETQVQIPVSFRGQVMGLFRADLIVNGLVVIELKAVDSLLRQDESQTLHYLKATTIEVALLMNFGMEPRVKRFVMDNESKQSKKKLVSSALIGVKSFAAPEAAL